jgi:hypothetical protein
MAPERSIAERVLIQWGRGRSVIGRIVIVSKGRISAKVAGPVFGWSERPLIAPLALCSV